MQYPQSFKSKKEAFAFLQAQGFKVSRAKFYKDVKGEGFLIQEDGSILGEEVRRYTVGLKRLGGFQDIEALQRQKVILENRKLEQQALQIEEKRERESGRWILKEEFYAELAGRLAVFDSALKSWIYTEASQWIRLVEGEPEQVKLLIETMLEGLADRLDEVGRIEEFEVVIDEF